MRHTRPVLSTLVLLVLVLPCSRTGRAQEEKLPEGRSIVDIEVHPETIALRNRFDYSQVVLRGTLDTGERVDLTRMASVVGPDAIVTVSPTRLVRPLADGAGELRLEIGDRSVSIPVRVTGQGIEHRVSYVQDVMPVLSRIGCNAGTCHGAASGRNGFKLSLRGYDPLFDHRALTDDLKGRRFNRADPDKSLFLAKISGRAPHTGGVLARPGEPYYELLRSWVADGVQLDLESPRVVGIEVIPSSAVLPLPGMRHQVKVLAKYSDGQVRDVTVESFVESSSTEIATVDADKIITAVRRGETAALVRYEGHYASAQLFVMGNREGFEWKETPTYNRVDDLVYAKLQRIKSLPSDVCTDAEFMRRVYLDLVGLPPTSKDVRIFLADARDSRVKREELVDRLIGSSEFVEFWTNKWSDLLQVNSKFLGRPGARVFRDWIRGAVASNMPYDRFVYEILNSTGSTLKNPPTAYYKVLREPDEAMENTTQLFLGIRFNCNKCHDHPFERWTEDNHWQLAAFFAQIERKDAPGSKKMPRRSATQTYIPAFEEIVEDRSSGEVSYPGTGETAEPLFPYEHQDAVPVKGTRRGRLAMWVTSPKNPYFAMSYVNRLWSYFLGIGIIEPVDDIRAGNPPTNPELLDWLTEQFIESGFDTRHIMRLITKSRAYQHSIETNRWNEGDSVNFAHAMARRLPAETLFDAVHLATGTVSRLPGQRAGTRAAELPDPSTKLADGFLDLFGRPPRESACECERSSGMSLGQALTLVNGPTVANAINDPNNAIVDLVTVEKRTEKVVEELFLSILCRPPTPDELKTMAQTFDHRNMENVAALTPENTTELNNRLAAFEKSIKVIAWDVIEPGIGRSAGGATLTRNDDGSILVEGAYPERDTYTVVAFTNATGITGLRLEVLPDEKLKTKDVPGPGRAENGNFVLNELIVTAASASDPTQTKTVALQNATATHSQKDFDVARAIDGKRAEGDKGWGIDGQTGRRHRAVFETKEDIGFPGGTILTFTLDQQHPKHTIGKFRLSLTTTERPIRLMGTPENIVAILLTPADQRTDEQRATFYRYFIDRDRDMVERIRLNAAQDLTWALINNPAFLFNR